MIAAAAFLLLATGVVTGDSGRAPFLCHSHKAALRLGIAVDLNEQPAEMLIAMLRGSECVYLPRTVAPVVIFKEKVDHQENTDVWRVQWGNEDWFVPMETPGKDG